MSALFTCTAKLGKALLELGQLASGSGTQLSPPEAIQRMVEIATRYGLWFGSREENAAVGIVLG
jgi:hypothetical protein